MTNRYFEFRIGRLPSLAAGGVCALAAIVLAGPLDPPAGTIKPTYKTIAEAEPRTAINQTNTPGDADSVCRIAKPGSYYLTGNLTGESGKCGIEIASSSVSIDLMGFELVGVIGSTAGITTSINGAVNLKITNGSIHDWGYSGIDFANRGESTLIISHIIVQKNVNTGISAGINATVSNCVARENGTTGIFFNGSGTATDCSSYGNSYGFYSFGSTEFSKCAASNNSTAGFSLGSGGLAVNCVASNNDLGFSASSGSTVRECIARSNTTDGISAGSRCFIISNSCDNNGSSGDGAGIRVSNNSNRIEGNHCSNADRGIEIVAAGNVIIRNTCTGNGANWAIAANNSYGPVIDRTSIATAAVNTNAASAALGSTDANANYSY